MSSVILIPPLCFLYFVFKYHSLGYFCFGAAALILFYSVFFLPATQKIRTRLFAFNPLILFVLAAAGLSLFGAWQYFQMNDQGDMDQSYYSMAFWNMRHGTLHHDFDGKNMFGIHSQYTATIWLPVQIFFGDLGLKLFQGFGLIFSSLFLTRLLWKSSQEDQDPAQKLTNRNAALWASLAILLAAPVASQFFYGFHPELIGAPFLVVALYTYRKQNLWGFLICTALLAYTKETFTLVVGGILLLALIEKRNWKWIFLPGILCCVQMGIYWFLILPHFAPKGNMLSGLMPHSLHDVFHNWFRLQTLVYFFQASLPFLPLLLVMPKKYLILPIPLMLFYAAFPDSAFMVMWVNYPFPTAFLFSAGLILETNLNFSANAALDKTHSTKMIDLRIVITCALIALLSYPLWREIFTVPMANLHRSREVDKLNASIPLNSSVIVNTPSLTRFAPRREISTWVSHVKPLDYFEYAVIDTVLPFWGFTPHQRKLSVDSLMQNPNWKMEYGENGLYLFHRK